GRYPFFRNGVRSRDSVSKKWISSIVRTQNDKRSIEYLLLFEIDNQSGKCLVEFADFGLP
ncbi:MAG: hypothetical protein L7V87_05075, partial [Verrucomicrobiales bacterium]|nr:hypothetical protein [Verrucomicrobiales bacterium]